MDLHDPRIAKPRTLDELKADVIDRVKNNGYPGRGLPLEPAESAMQALKTLEPDDWAAVWIAEADRLAFAVRLLHAVRKPRDDGLSRAQRRDIALGWCLAATGR